MTPAFRLSHVALSTGVRMHYAESGNPAGDPIVFVHGWPDSWFSYSRVLPLLRDRFHAFAIDLRGFGASDKPASGYSIPGFANDVVAFLDALAIRRAALVGHSYGSFVARRTALAHPLRVASLMLIGTGFRPATNPVVIDLKASLRDLPDPIPIGFARDFQSTTIHRPIAPDFFDGLIAESLKLPRRLWPLLIDRLAAYDDTTQLRQIAAPTLLLWGDRDALFSRQEQDRFLEALPTARLTLYDDTGHCPNWERPEDVANDVAAFVDAHRSSAIG